MGSPVVDDIIHAFVITFGERRRDPGHRTAREQGHGPLLPSPFASDESPDESPLVGGAGAALTYGGRDAVLVDGGEIPTAAGAARERGAVDPPVVSDLDRVEGVEALGNRRVERHDMVPE